MKLGMGNPKFGMRNWESVIRNPNANFVRNRKVGSTPKSKEESIVMYCTRYSVVVCEQMSKLNFIHTCIYLSTLYGNKTNVFVILKTWQRAVGAVNAKMLDELQGDTII